MDDCVCVDVCLCFISKMICDEWMVCVELNVGRKDGMDARTDALGW